MIEEDILADAADEQDATQLAAGVVESYVRRYPDQWSMFRPFWEKAH
jgi:lauroyl/myristoyl acyltransferase